MKPGFLAVVLLLPAFAVAKTGNDLQADCSIALKYFNNESVSGEPIDFIKIGSCIGFVNGVMQAVALKSPGSVQAKDPATQFCARPDVSVEQAVRMSLNRLKRNPDELRLDAAAVVLRALDEDVLGEPCIEGSSQLAEGLHWPDLPKKARMRVRLVAVALDLPRSSFFSNEQVLVAEKEIEHEEYSLIKLVFTYLPYQPRISESGFDYSVVHEVLAWRNPECDETVAQLTARTMPDRHEPMAYSRNVPRQDLELRHMPLPCYETRAADYIRSSLEPVPPPPSSLDSAFKLRRKLTVHPPEAEPQTSPNPR